MPRMSYAKGGQLADRSSRTRKVSATPSQSLSGQTLPSDQSKQSSEKTVSRPTSAASRANTAKSLKSPVKDGSAKKTKKKPPLTVAVNKDVQHRRKPGKRAAIEVRHLQQTTHRLISCAGFAQVVKSIVFNGETKGAERNTVRYQRGALALLQEASEAYLTGMFQDAQSLCDFVGRKTIMQKDLSFVNRLRKNA